jgi:hypothetical protein
MKATIRRRLSMARRALDYATAHPIDDDGFKIALQRLAAAVTQATALGLQETGGLSGQHSAVAQRQAARNRIRRDYLIRVVRIGQQAADSNTALLGVFNLPPISEPNKHFLLDARTLHSLAAEHEATLVPLGLGSTFVADLGTALDQFEAMGTAIDTGRGEHVGAVRSFQKSLLTCRSIVSVIDTWYHSAYDEGDATMEGWLNARSIEGPFTRSKENTPPAPVAPPAADTRAA